MKNKYHQLILLVLIMIAVAAVGIVVNEKIENDNVYYAENGILDLEEWNQSELPIVEMNGEWCFYPNVLRGERNPASPPMMKTVPHFWESDPDLEHSPYGYGTYRLQVTGLKPLSIYGLEVLDEVTAYHLYANNKSVASNGIVSSEKSTYRPQWHPVQSVFQADENGRVVFVMEIANFDYNRGGFWNSIKIGDVKDIIADANEGKIMDMFLFASIFIVGIMNLVLYFLYSRREYTTLYFALFCFCMSSRVILTGQRLISDLLPGINWHLLNRLEYFFGYCLLPIFGLFVLSLLENHTYPMIQKRLFQVLLICSFLITAVPNSIYTAFLLSYKLFSVVYILYFTVIIIKAVVQQQASANIMLFAILGITLAVIKEVFFGGPLSWMPFATLNFIVCFSLITFQKFLYIIHENEILGTKVIQDPLTGLHNRNYLMGLIEKNQFIKNDDHKIYLMFLDLDRFKEINDTYGHKIGDYVLQETGRRLNSILRETDIICRYGGDEFVIILDVKLENIKMIAEKIIQIIQEPFILDGHRYSISVSIGITEIDTDKENMDAVLRSSDQAMYEAKRSGGGCYFIRQQ